jgi:hypothetical protein
MNVAPDRAEALAAAFDGIYHIFGGRVESWGTNEDGLFANGLTVDGRFDPEMILNAITSHVRRAPLMPTLRWINGEAPADFANSQAVTTFTVQYFKNANDSKVPEWVRAAAQEYKNGREGFYQRRGPKPRAIQLKDISSVNVGTLTAAGVNIADLEHLVQVAQEALAASRATEPTTVTADAS